MMAKIERFEDVVAWQLARDLVNAVYSATKEEQFTKDFGLCDQIRRASISVMANIAEGFDAGSDAELVRFLRYSLRYASETQSHLYAALDQNYINTEIFNKLYKLAGSTKVKIHGFIGYLIKNRSRRTLKEMATYYET